MDPFFQTRGAAQARKDLGLSEFTEKTAVLGHLLAGPIGHVVSNALGRTAHKNSNLAAVLAYKGLQHGFTDSTINPAALQSIVAMVGPEALAGYRAAVGLGKRLAKVPPETRAQLLSAAAKAPIDPHVPILGPLREAVEYELKGTAPTLTATGMGSKLYSKYIDSLSNVTNTPFDTAGKRVLNTITGALPVAGTLAADPIGASAHFGINKARDVVSRTDVGKRVAKGLFEKGLGGSTPTKTQEFLIDHLISPGVLDPLRVGNTAAQKGVTPEAYQRTLQAVPTVKNVLSAAKQPPELPKLAAEFAPGIPEGRKIDSLPEVRKPQTWQMAIQEHDADAAGKHWDLRLIDPQTGKAHSWAIPKAKLPAPGEKVLVVQQPTHTKEYSTTFGLKRPEKIESGYGKGTVHIRKLEDVDVYHATPEEKGTRLRFNLYKSTGPEEYALVRTSSGMDLLVNKTRTAQRLKNVSIGHKPKMREQKIKHVDITDSSQVLMPKYDGAHTLLDLHAAERIPRLYSVRQPKRHTAGVIEHTHKVPSLLETRVPKELKGTVLRSETVGIDRKGKAVPAKDIAGMLNATVPTSRKKQEEMGAHLETVLFDIDYYKGKDVRELPFRERYDLVKEIGQKLKLPVTDIAVDSKSKQRLINDILKKRHPMTSEGVIVRPWDKADTATKAKVRPDHDVYVREIFEATDASGKGKGRAGGFYYSWTPRGPIAGRVGTGFTHMEAADMLNNPNKYVGRVAKVEAEQIYASGKLAKPAFIEWHLDK